MLSNTRFLTLGFLLACSAPAAQEEIIDVEDSLLGLDEDKADAPAISEVEVLRALEAANVLAESDLRRAGLATTVARGVIRYRSGADARSGTSDDQTFDSLAELDRVSGLGPLVLQRLRTAGASMVPSDALRSHDVSVLFPASDPAALWPATTAGRGGALLPKPVFDQIGLSLLRDVREAEEYGLLRVVGLRVDPCFLTSSMARCQPQLRLIFQAFQNGRSLDGAIHALYNLTDAEFATLVGELRTLSRTATQNAPYAALGVSPVLRAQGVNGAYGQGLKTLAVRYAGATSLARMTFMTRTQHLGGEWEFGGFHVRPNTTTGFPAAGPILTRGERIQLVTNSGSVGSVGSREFDYQVRPEFDDAAGRLGTSAVSFLFLPPEDKTSLHSWTTRQSQGSMIVADGTDCASCHLSQHVRNRVAQDAAFAGVDGASHFRSEASGFNPDNLRMFGYFNADAHVALRTANETMDVVRALYREM